MSADTHGKAIRPQRRIQSIEVGFRLISVLEKATTKLPLKLIAERAGMPASKAHLYMVSFSRIGLVAQDPTSMRYGLGPYAVQLGLAGLRQLDVFDAARIPMEELQSRCGLSVFLSVWGNLGPTVVAKVDGELELPIVIKVGYVMSLFNSGTARVFLASLPSALIEPVLAQGNYDRAKARRIIREAKQEVGENGVALSGYDVFDGFAAPVLDINGHLSATITVLGPRSQVEININGKLARDLKLTCEKISRSMGVSADKTAKEGRPKSRL